MKTKIFLFFCALCLLSPVYAQKVMSLYPLYNERDVIMIPKLEGEWDLIDFDMKITFQKAGDNFYLLKYGSGSGTSTYEAIFVKINDDIFLDLSGTIPDTLGDQDYRNCFVTAHSLYKIQLTNDSMKLYDLNYSWFYNYIVKNKSTMKHEWFQNAMLLTCGTEELKSFLADHGNEPDIFNGSITLKNKHISLTEIIKTSNNDSKVKSTSNFFQKCIPEFPFKEGWLGGDGDVSVPISETTNLFIFSDTYVGNKNQQSRNEPGLKMVSNTVAVQNCLPDGKTEVHYFWNKMYSENPEPVFKSFTNRYIYWVNDGFMVKDNLYVLLEKIGKKSGVSPDDMFTFSLLGFTLAKISNPHESPVDWKIELIPLPNFGNPLMGIRCHVIIDDYIYFFVSRFDKYQVLVRKKIDFIDNPEKPFEYFALDKKWKEGLDTNDMDTIVNGFRSNTVKYHPEMKQWVMICDIMFMDNKIKMRTSPELTGPWSDEKSIYEIPEVTPGNPLYSKTNFCYLARECIQNYDSKKHVMLITYDINNSSFSEINSKPYIYTPKVIKVPLMNTRAKKNK